MDNKEFPKTLKERTRKFAIFTSIWKNINNVFLL